MPLFLNVSFRENIFICFINGAKKSRIFLVRTRLFVYLNDRYVLNGSYASDSTLTAIIFNQVFC